MIRRIAIYREGQSLTVVPRQRDADAGHDIVFVNTTQETMTVSIPDAGLFGATKTLTISPKSNSTPQHVDADASGGYPYSVYSGDTREFAHASVPIIIIYPH